MFNGPEVWIVLVVIVLVFGSSNLPKLARNLGKAQQEFKSSLEDSRTRDTTHERHDDAGSTDTGSPNATVELASGDAPDPAATDHERS